MKRGTLVLLAVVLVALPGAAFAGSADGEPEACVAFSGTPKSSLTGRAELVAHRRNSELGLIRLEHMKPSAAHVFWLQPEGKEGFWVGGVIKADRRGTFQGDTEIKGAPAVAERHVKRTRSILVTRTAKRGVRKIVKRYRPSGWTRAGRPIGRVVAHGELSPPRSQGFWPCHRP